MFAALCVSRVNRRKSDKGATLTHHTPHPSAAAAVVQHQHAFHLGRPCLAVERRGDRLLVVWAEGSGADWRTGMEWVAASEVTFAVVAPSW